MDHVFQILDTEDVPVKQIMSYLAILLQKSENELPTSSKNHIILWEKLKITSKKTNDLEKLYPDVSEEGKEEKAAGHVWVFPAKI